MEVNGILKELLIAGVVIAFLKVGFINAYTKAVNYQYQ